MSTPRQLRLEWQETDRELRREMRREMVKIGRAMKRAAYKWSSGTMTEEDRRALDYPYATRHHGGSAGNWNEAVESFEAFTGGSAGLINVDDADFRASWHWRTRETATGITGTLWNDSRHADFLLEGTEFMIARPIFSAILHEVDPELEESADDLIAFLGGRFDE